MSEQADAANRLSELLRKLGTDPELDREMRCLSHRSLLLEREGSAARYTVNKLWHVCFEARELAQKGKP